MKVPRVALVQMPWSVSRYPSLALATLKSFLRGQGLRCDVFYPSLLWAKRIGLGLNDRLSYTELCAEWFFSYSLFGPEGTGEIDNGWARLAQAEGMGEDWLRGYFHDPSDSRDWALDWERLAREEVPGFLEDCLRRYPWSRADVIGFSTVFNQNLASLSLAKRLKERYPDKLIVFGGGNVSGEMGLEHLRAFDWIDAVVDGEGEVPLAEIARAVAAGGLREPIAGAHWRRGGRIVSGPASLPPPLDASPIPDHSDYFKAVEDYRLKPLIRPVVTFESSRGCWWGQRSPCAFCGIYDMRYRAKSGPRLLKEITALSRKHRTGSLAAVDNILDMKYFKDLFPRLRRLKLDLRLGYDVKPSLKKPQLRLMRGAGMDRVLCGIETLSTRALRLMDKGIRAIQNVEFLKNAREYGLRVGWNHLCAIPGLARTDYDRALRVACAISHLQPSRTVVDITVLRFTPYHAQGGPLGIRNIRPKGIYRFLYPQRRVDLSRIAYYFQHDLDDSAMHAECGAELKRLWAFWRKAYDENETFLFFERLPGVLNVYDRRIRGPADPGLSFRRHSFAGLHRALYLFCDSARSSSEILAFAARRGGRRSEAEVLRVLRELVDSETMLYEDGCYLSLALPASAYPRSVREKADSLLSSAWLREPPGTAPTAAKGENDGAHSSTAASLNFQLPAD